MILLRISLQHVTGPVRSGDVMESKALAGILMAAVIGLIGWNIKTTHELTLQVQKLEIILLNDAFAK